MLKISRKERDKLLRKSDILNAAEYVFATKGYHDTAMADIAKSAQYAVGTLYLYFKDKEELYLTLIEDKLNGLILKVKEAVFKKSGAYEKLGTLIETQLAYFEENENFFHIYFSERGNYGWAIKDRMPKKAIDILFKYFDFVAEIIKDAQKENFVRNDFESRRLAFILGGMLNSVIIPWLKTESPKKERLRDLSGFVLEIFLNGMGVKK